MTTDRILITGATGFVGRHVVTALLDRGFRLALVVRNATSCLPGWRENNQISIIEAIDLASPGVPATAMESAFSGVRTVVHLAGLAHIATADKADASTQFMQVNAEATRKLVDAARVSRVGSFIHLSSLAAITANACDATIDDSTVYEPETAYGRSKRAAEVELRALSEAGVFAVSLRPPLIVGAEAKGNWASLQALARTGLPLPFASITNKRSFISVQSIAEAIITLCSSNWPSELSGNYCLADPEPMPLPHVVAALREGMGTSARLLPCPPAAFAAFGALIGRQRQLAGLTGALRVDSSRFYSNFGFTPTLALEEAIRQSGAAYSAARRAKVSDSPIKKP